MTLKEEDCWIYWDRPLKKMEKRIRKLTPDPSADVLECGNSWGGSAEFKLRETTPSEDILFMGSVTSNQYQNIKAILGMGSPSRDAYKSHRKGYVYSEKEKQIAEKVKSECKEKVCAIVIQGDLKSSMRDYITGYTLGDPEVPTDPYELHYGEIVGFGTRDGKTIRRSREFSSILDAKSFLESKKDADYHSFVGTTLKKVKHYIPLSIEWETEKKSYDKVKYFQLA